MTKNTYHRLQFIDSSTRFMESLLSNLVNNLAEGIHKIKCKYGHDNKKCETCRIEYRNCECFFQYTSAKDDSIKYKCLYCNNSYQQMFDENLKKMFVNKFSNHDINKFTLLLLKGVDPYRDDWEKLSETLFSEKEDL